jgi:hypothetical protein
MEKSCARYVKTEFFMLKVDLLITTYYKNKSRQ